MNFANREDEDLAFMLKFENVAWYENGTVRILDRSIYPIQTRFVTCRTYQDVAKAIADMITQSEGPYTAAAMGMVLAAYECQGKQSEEILAYMQNADYVLSHARPTTAAQMQGIVDGALEVVRQQLAQGITGQKFVDAVNVYAYNYENNNYKKYAVIAHRLAEKVPNNGTVMTQCFAGTVVGLFIRECQRMDKNIKMICAETRPYYQGARLTASVACDMGVDTTVICDNMPAYTMKTKGVDIFTSASDVITMDGHVVNKVGTFQIAMAAHYYGIPYYCTGEPDQKHPDMSNVIIEERNPNLVMDSLGTKTTMNGVKGYYPAFDVTPPEFITGIVTERGIYRPEDVHNFFDGGEGE